MSIQEMHIDLLLKLNSIAGYAYRGLEKDEIDWYLNQSTYKFLHSIINPKSDKKEDGFQATTNRYDEIEALMVRAEYTPYVLNANEVYIPFPSDLFHTDNVYCWLGKACTPTGTETAKPYRYAVVPFNPTEVITSAYNLSVQISAGSTSIFTGSSVFAFPLDVDLNFRIVEAVLRRSLLPANIKVYWERYDTIYRPSSFIFVMVDTTETLTSVTKNLNGSNTVYNSSLVDRKEYTVTGDVEFSDTRLTDHIRLNKITDNPYAQSQKNNPVAYLYQGKAIIQHWQRFDVQSIGLTYIRWPQPLSHSMNQSLELGSTPARKYDIGRRIVDNAAEMIALGTPNPVTQGIMTNNTLNS